jgi:hypothetical protein
MILNPYDTEDYLYERAHLIKIWCDLFNIPYNGEQPELFFSQREISYVRNTIISKINKPKLKIEINKNIDKNKKYNINVIYRTYNIFRLMSGFGSLTFD